MVAGVVDTGEQFITGDNDTGNNFVAGDNNTGDKFIAGHKTRHWNRHEKLDPKTPHTSWSEPPEAAKTK